MKQRILAALTALALVFSLSACATTPEQAPPPAQETSSQPPDSQAGDQDTPDAADSQGPFTPGVYSAQSNGYGGVVSIQVEVDSDSILSVTVLESSETVGIGQVALERLSQQVVEEQSLAVDGISGATYSSNALLAAAEEALGQAADDISFLLVKFQAAATVETQLLETDVVVVGAGLAGLCAAVSAGEHGAQVVLLEKLSITGGSAQTSLGSYMVCEVPENEGYHVTDEEDTLEDAKKRWSDYQVNSFRDSQYPDMDRVTYMLTESMFTIHWLKQWGATFAPKTPIAERGMAMVQVDVPALEEMGGTPAGRLLEQLKQVALEQGAQLYLETPATQLITEDDRVVGVQAESPQGQLEIHAGSVILATGGFSESPELLARFIPDLGEIYSIGSSGNTGDGILMAEAVGAALYEEPWVHACWPGPTWEFKAASPYATIFMDSTSPLDIEESSYYRLMVDQDGQRFMNEAGHYSLQVVTMVNHKNGPYWSLYDNLGQQAAHIAEAGLSTGTVIKGDTIADLAQQLGVEPETLQATVDRYNEMAQAGVDEDFGKPGTHLSPIGEGPYYMVQMLPSACDTLGGVLTNYDQQVLREDLTVIEGLYAVGSVSNRQYYNQMYFSGSSLTFASTAGKNAGRLAAESN